MNLITTLSRIEYKLDVLTRLFVAELSLERIMSAQLDQLTAQVAKNTSIEESAVTLIAGLASQIAAAGTDPVALQALTDGLTKSANDLAAAIAANTPAQTPPATPAADAPTA